MIARDTSVQDHRGRLELLSIERRLAFIPERPLASPAPLIGRRSILSRIGLEYWPTERDNERYKLHKIECNMRVCPDGLEPTDLERSELPAGLAPNDRRRERLRILRDYYRRRLAPLENRAAIRERGALP